MVQRQVQIMAVMVVAALVLSVVETAQPMQSSIPAVVEAEPLPDVLATAEAVVRAL
jgi:hypothetical protein